MTNSQSPLTARAPGAALLITGLPAAGKTILAMALATLIESRHARLVTLLDGDQVRQLLSSELGYSRDHRRLNVLRLATSLPKFAGMAESRCAR